jgi:exportin-1
MRAVKKETLKLVQAFVNSCSDNDKETICNKFLPALLDPVLDDYKRNVPEARDAEVARSFLHAHAPLASQVLMLFATVVKKLGTVVRRLRK